MSKPDATDTADLAALVNLAARLDPGEANEPDLCPCGGGYIGHAEHDFTGPTDDLADFKAWRDANIPGGE